MSKQTIIAIDPSLNGTAVCIGSHPERFHMKRFESRKIGGGTRNRLVRVEDLVFRIWDFCQCDEPISHIVIEDYSYGTNDSGARFIAEFRGVLMFHLVTLQKGEPIIVDANIQQLKKFVTGKANTKKELLRVETFKRWQVEFETNDEIDAYGLYRMGLCLNGLCLAETKAQREVINKLQQDIASNSLDPAPF